MKEEVVVVVVMVLMLMVGVVDGEEEEEEVMFVTAEMMIRMKTGSIHIAQQMMSECRIMWW